MHNFGADFRKESDFLNLIDQNDLVSKFNSFTFEP